MSAPRTAGIKIAPEFFERLLASDDATDALHQLDSFWCARPGRSEREARFGLSQPEFDVHLYLWYLGEVGNGGHHQFFLNPAGQYAAATLEALERLGLQELRLVLLDACGVFPGSDVPTDTDARQAIVNRLPQTTLARWAGLDRRLYALDTASWPKVLAYVRANQHEVLVGERS